MAFGILIENEANRQMANLIVKRMRSKMKGMEKIMHLLKVRQPEKPSNLTPWSPVVKIKKKTVQLLDRGVAHILELLLRHHRPLLGA